MADDAVRNGDDVVDELRLALAMSGGIALVLYQSGVAHELERFIRAWRVVRGGEVPDANGKDDLGGYREMFADEGSTRLRPVVDVLTGASAGGINGVLLGNCLTLRKPFAPFRNLWVNGLDARQMRYDDAPGVRKSLYRVDELLDRARQQLATNIGRFPPEPDPSLGLRVRLSWTHLRGHCVSLKDALGHTIQTNDHAATASFDETDFRDPQHVDALVAAGQATSAFPVAFPPVRHEGRWYVDGGLVNNQPIDLAVDAIRDKPAYGRTQRVVLFIDPDPTIRADDGLHQPEPDFTLSDVGLGLPFMGLKGSILPAISDIQATNARYRQYRELFDDASYLRQAKAQGRVWLKSRPEPLRERRLVATLLDGDPALLSRWRALEERLGTAFMDRAKLAACEALADVDLLRRRYRRKLERTNINLKAEGRTVTSRRVGTHGRKGRLYQRLNALNEALAARERSHDPVQAVLRRSAFWLPAESFLEAIEEATDTPRRETAMKVWVEAIEGIARAARLAAGETHATRPDPLDVFREVFAGIADLDAKFFVNLVRISPNDAQNYHLVEPGFKDDGTPAAARKLAGEGLGHFQGLLDARWRRNDYIWARLDACEILLRTYQVQSAAIGVAIADAQIEGWREAAFEAILKEEAADAGIEEPDRLKRNKALIGLGGGALKDLDPGVLAQNAHYALDATARLFRGDPEKLPAEIKVPLRVARLAALVVQGTAFLVPKVHRTFASVVLVILAVFVVFGAGYGVALHGAGRVVTLVTDVLTWVLFGLLVFSLGTLVGWKRWVVGWMLPLLGVAVGLGASELQARQTTIFGLSPVGLVTALIVVTALVGIGLFAIGRAAEFKSEEARSKG